MVTVLLVLISAVCLAVVYFGLAMCQLAARTDELDDSAMAEWTTSKELIELEAEAAEDRVERLPYDPQRPARRAAG